MDNKDFSQDEAVKKVQGTIEDRGKLMATMIKHMEAAGVEDVEKIASEAAYELGQMDGQGLKDVKTAGELAKRLFTPITLATFEAEIVEDGDDKAVVVIHNCPLVVGWKKAGLTPEEVDNICNLANIRDDGLASELPLNLGFTTRIAAGDSCCTFVITKKK